MIRKRKKEQQFLYSAQVDKVEYWPEAINKIYLNKILSKNMSLILQ